MNYLGNASTYLTEALLGFALYVVLLRFWMQWVKADFRNPLGQFILTVTKPVVVPLRRFFPPIRSIDTATIIFALAVAILKTLIIAALFSRSLGWLSLIAYSFGELIRFSIYIFMVAIFIQIIASWVSPHSYHPLLDIAHSIAEPMLAPARRLLPPIAGLDLSPILVFIFLRLSLILVVAPIQAI